MNRIYMYIFSLNATGFRCHIESCKRLVPGHVDELKRHFKFDHGLNTSAESAVLYKCSECGSLYSFFRSLKRHLLAAHPETKHYEQVTTDFCEAGPSGLQNPVIEEIVTEKIIDSETTRSTLISKIRDFVTSMRSDPSLPESKIQAFMVAMAGILDHYQQYTINVVEKYLADQSIPFTDDAEAEMLSNLKIDKLFDEVQTPEKNLNYLASLAGCPVPLPNEIVLGKRKVKKLVNLQPALGKKPKHIRSIKLVKDTAHYISILETLSLVIRPISARQMIQNEMQKENEGKICFGMSSCFLFL